MFLGGGYEYTVSDEILELVDGEWRQVATMQSARYAHAVTVINLDLYIDYCN